MDPDIALARLVELCERIANGAPQDMEWTVLVPRAEELAETFLGLDEWARRGGFLPKAWQHKRSAPDGAMQQQRIALLEKACRALLQDTDEVLERQGETWWDDTVTSGLHHRQEARRILGDEAGR